MAEQLGVPSLCCWGWTTVGMAFSNFKVKFKLMRSRKGVRGTEHVCTCGEGRVWEWWTTEIIYYLGSCQMATLKGVRPS